MIRLTSFLAFWLLATGGLAFADVTGRDRKTGDGSRFDKLLETVVGRRLTYRVLCAINDAGFMGIK